MQERKINGDAKRRKCLAAVIKYMQMQTSNFLVPKQKEFANSDDVGCGLHSL